MSHEAWLVQCRLSIGEHDVIVSQVAVHYLAPDALPAALRRQQCALPGQQLLCHCLPLLHKELDLFDFVLSLSLCAQETLQPRPCRKAIEKQ